MATMIIDILLKKYKLSQRELAESTGINENTISRYCNGTFKKIDKLHISLICKYFKCTPNDIFVIDDTVEIKPAQIAYYDSETDDFAYGEIAKPTSSKDIWGSLGLAVYNASKGNIKNKGIETNDFNEFVEYAKINGIIPTPNDVLIKSEKVVSVGNSACASIIKKPSSDKQSQSLEEPKNYYSEEYEDPIASMSKEEYADYTKIINGYQIRFDIELKLDKSISDFINKILDLFISNIGTTDLLIQLSEQYKKYDYFTTNLKINKCYKMLHAFSNEYLKNNALTRTIININNIYTHGGLDKLTDDEIKKLQNIVDYYLHDDLEYTNKD